MSERLQSVVDCVREGTCTDDKTHCPTCGSAVRVVSSDEGTSYYERVGGDVDEKDRKRERDERPEYPTPAPESSSKELGELLDVYKLRITEARPGGNVEKMQAEAAARRAIEEYDARREHRAKSTANYLREELQYAVDANDQLREQLHEQEQVNAGVREYHENLKAENARLREQLEAAQKERDRYRKGLVEADDRLCRAGSTLSNAEAVSYAKRFTQDALATKTRPSQDTNGD